MERVASYVRHLFYMLKATAHAETDRIEICLWVSHCHIKAMVGLMNSRTSMTLGRSGGLTEFLIPYQVFQDSSRLCCTRAASRDSSWTLQRSTRTLRLNEVFFQNSSTLINQSLKTTMHIRSQSSCGTSARMKRHLHKTTPASQMACSGVVWPKMTQMI